MTHDPKNSGPKPLSNGMRKKLARDIIGEAQCQEVAKQNVLLRQIADRKNLSEIMELFRLGLVTGNEVRQAAGLEPREEDCFYATAAVTLTPCRKADA